MFDHRDQVLIHLANTHWDDRGLVARHESGKLLRRIVPETARRVEKTLGKGDGKRLEGVVVLMGDLSECFRCCCCFFGGGERHVASTRLDLVFSFSFFVFVRLLIYPIQTPPPTKQATKPSPFPSPTPFPLHRSTSSPPSSPQLPSSPPPPTSPPPAPSVPEQPTPVSPGSLSTRPARSTSSSCTTRA